MIDAIDDQACYSLTHAQRRIQHGELLYPGTAFANVSVAFTFPAEVDLAGLDAAVHAVIARNDAFRLRLRRGTDGGLPTQYVAAADPGPLPRATFAAPDALREWALEQAGVPFSGYDEPLVRVQLACCGDRTTLLLVAHHVVCDNGSAAQFVRQVVEDYHSVEAGRDLPGPKPSYLDYLEEEQAYLRSDECGVDRAFWLDRLSAPPEYSALFGKDRPIDRIDARRLDCDLPPEVTARLAAYCEGSGISYFRVFTAAFAIWLARCVGREDVVLGVPYHNRPGDARKGSLGHFVSTLPLRLQFTAQDSFAQVVARVDQELTEAIRHQRYPFDLLMDDLRRDQGLAGRLMEYHVVQSSFGSLPDGVTADVLPRTSSPEPFALYLNQGLSDSGGLRRISYEYQVARYSDAEVARLHDSLLTVLAGALGDPTLPACELPLVPAAERELLLESFNANVLPVPWERSYHGMFREQVARTPDRPAVAFRDTVLTYRQLDEKTDRLAICLRGKGVGRGTVVPVMLERSAEMVVASIAVMKAGGAYLPLDIKYPQARLEFMLADSEATLILSQPSLREKFRTFAGEFVDVTDGRVFAVAEPLECPDVNDGKDLAAIIYTSGSTGTPKGTMITHGGIVNLCFSENRDNRMTEADVTVSYASFSFDAAIWSNFAPLLAGAVVHIVPDEILLSLVDLNQFIEERGATVTFMTTQLCEQFMELVDNHTLRLLVTGGEKFKAWRPTPYTVVNAYGPTEHTVMTTRFVIDGNHDNMPIGKPVANTRVYVVDAGCRLQPLGVPGELCVSGPGLARGYRKRPELTAEKFVANPFATGDVYGRMYRTGDLVRWLPDGNLEYLGRIDQQVKIRGFRIELGEIEQKLTRYEGVKAAVVIARDDPAGNKYLCGYLVAEAKVDVDALKAFLLHDLPPFMVPQHLMQLDALPLNANGKVDRRALPEITIGGGDTEYVAPRSELEHALCDLWQEILGAKHVGITDTFNSLGGTSLKLVLLGAKLRKQFSVALSVAELTRIPTVAKLAERILQASPQAGSYEAIPILPPAETYAVSPAQKAMFILDRMADIGNTYHVVEPLILEGLLDKERLGRAIDQLVERHASLRTSFAIVDGEIRQRVHTEVRLKKTLKSVDEQAIDRAIDDFIHPFDLGEAPLLRIALMEINPHRHLLLIDAHHIVVDGVSVVVLIQELMKIYLGEALPPLTLAYHDYAAWYTRYLAGPEVAKQEAYWLDHLKGELPVLNLTTDFPRPANKKYQGGKVFASVPKAAMESLKALAHEQQVTPFALLMAAFKTMLARYTWQDDIVIGSPFSNRTHPDVDRVVGMFVNTLPLRTHPRSDRTFREYVQEVHEVLLAASENQNYPFDALVSKLGLRPDASRNPVYDVVFAYFVEEFLFESGGISIRPHDYDEKQAHFDLLFYVMENRDGLSLFVEYDSHLYRKESAQRMLDHYVQLLQVLADGIDRPLAEIDFTPPAERERVLRAFNANHLDVPLDRPWHALFRDQAARTPDRPALAFKDTVLTYRELDERTDRLACYLRGRGVDRGAIVPVMLERSAEMVVSAIGVMKAGAAYLPLDTRYPQARLDFMLSDSNAALILSQPSLRDRFPAFGGEFVDVTDSRVFADPASPGCPDVNDGTDLAAVIYTSGSTGMPKGTMILHRNLVNMCCSENRDNAMTENDVMVSYASFSFDAAMWSNFCPLLAGAVVHIVPEEILLSLVDLNRFIEERRATVTFMTTQLCEQFTELVENTCLRILATGGEKYKTYRPTPYTIVNGYGPTEYTVYTTRFVIDKAYDNIPIGKPLANARLYVVDRGLRLQPQGVPGELCIAGPQLSGGYRNRPDLTAEKFVANPFDSGEIYGRLYRTGDLVRWLPDGNLEFLSRIDQQVKIRGFRIELGEVEQKIKAYPTVKEVVVVAKDDATGAKYLRAYFTADTAVELEHLKEFLAVDLPAYMIPAQIVQIDVMPLNANGKIDKKALPEVDGRAEGPAFVPPSTDTEKKIAAVWQDVLGVERVSATDNFFHLGGSSIKAISTVARLQKFFAISINDLFNHPCLQKLAENIRPAENLLKVRLAEIKQRAEGLDRPLTDTPAFKAIYDASMAAYEQANAALRTADVSEVRRYDHVLVTGATGFLGCHVARYLLTERNCRVSVVVRGRSVEDATARLQAKFDYYFGPGAELGERVEVLCGELHQPHLGLPDEQYERLCASVEAIFHCAANVRHYGHYQEFHESNVQATAELLTFARTGLPKEFHHVSTVSVAMGEIPGCEYHVFTEYQTDLGQQSGNFYVASKLEAEKLVVAARSEGVRANIYRVGNIAFQGATGRPQENLDTNAFYLALRGFINVGMVPDKLDEDEFSVVDGVAEAMVRLAERPALLKQTYHLQNPHVVKLSAMLTDPVLGLNVQAADVGTFFDYLYENIDQPGFKQHVEAILTRMGLLGESGENSATAVTVPLDKTVMVLSRVGFAWPTIPASALRPMVERALQERVDALRQNPVLGVLDRDGLLTLAGRAQMKLWKRRREILWEGQDSPDVYLVLKGFAQVLRSSVGGWQGMVGMAKRNDFIGLEMAAVADTSRFSVEATMGDTLVLALPRELLRAQGREHPPMLLAMMTLLCDRIDKLSRLVVSLG